MSLFCCFNVTLINMKTKTNENKNTSEPKEVSKTKKTTTKSVKKPKPAPKKEEIKVEEKPQEEDMFFLMFAHGYEFDFGTKESNWEKLEKICENVSSHDDIICCSISDAFRMHENR